MPSILHSRNLMFPLLQHMAPVPNPLPDPNYFATRPLHCSGSRPPQGAWQQCTYINHRENQACPPRHMTTHGYHVQAMSDPPNSGYTSSKGGYTKSEGGNHSNAKRLTTSNHIMSPNAIQQMPLIHQHHTRSNNQSHTLANYDNNDDTVVASHCSPCAPLPSQPSNDFPVNPAVHPDQCQMASQPALPPSTVQPNIPIPKVLANLSFIPATTATVT